MQSQENDNRGAFPCRVALGLTVAAVVLRCALLFAGPWQNTERALTPDSPHMVGLAYNLCTYYTYGKAEEVGLVHRATARLRMANGTAPMRDANGLAPEVFRPPGYPFFLAVFEAMSLDLRWALLCQCVLGGCLTWAVLSLAWSLNFSRSATILAGLLWAFHPGLIVFDDMLLTESLFNIFSVAGFFVAARAPARYSWLGSGILIGLAGLVRPLALLYEPLLLAVALKQGRLRWTTAAGQLLLILIPSGAWAARNYAVGEGFRVSTVPDVNLLYYSAAYSISEERGEDWGASWPHRIEELSEKLGTRLQPGEDVSSAGRRLALEELEARPRAYASVQAKSAAKLFVDHSLGGVYNQLGQTYVSTGLFSRLVLRQGNDANVGSISIMILAGGWMALNALICLAALVGAIRGLRARLRVFVIACGLTLVLFTLATASVGLERMRMPMMLPLVLLSGLALQSRGATTTALESPRQNKA
jgi:Dolichyl-phosphate-mannose-protein mannosyltransferase